MVSSVLLPRLSITKEDYTQLRATAAALEAEIMGQYEDFLLRQGRRVDRTKWKLARSDGDLHAHHESRDEVDELGFMSSSPKASSSLGPQASLAAKSSIGRVLVTGTIPGSVDDALLGSSFHDTPSLRTKEAYQRDFLDDSAVLFTIDGPSVSDPYQFLGVTWHLRNTVLGKPRDCLLLQHTHLTKLPTGERVGVSLRHSIEHRDLPELRDATRTRIVLSSVAIFRQTGVSTVEVFGIEFLDEKRHRLDAVQRHESGRDLLVLRRVCDAGFKMKLHALMRRRHREHRVMLQKIRPEDSRRECALCTKSTSGLFSSSAVRCQLCTKHVCARCTMTLDIVVDAATARVVAKPFAFCIECVLHTKALPTLALAQQEAHGWMEAEPLAHCSA